MISRVFTIFTVIFGVVGVVMLGICGLVSVNAQRFLSNSVITTGVVVEQVAKESCSDDDTSDCRTLYAPRVRFSTENGSPSTFTARSASNPPVYEVGNQVTVRYLTSDPTTARIDTVPDNWTGVWVTGGIAVVFLGFGAIFFAIRQVSRRWVDQPGPVRPAPATDVEPPEGYR